MNARQIAVMVDTHRTQSGEDLTVYVLPPKWCAQAVPGSASGPPVVRELPAGFHTAGAPAGGLAGVIRSAAGAGASLASLWRLLLIVVTVLGIVWGFTGCTTVTGNRNEGTFAYNSFLGNAKIGELGPEGLRNTEIDNATGAGVIERTAEKIGKAWAWGKAWDAAGKLIDRGFDALEDGNETDVRINAQDNAAAVATETFVPPEPPLP